MIMEPLRENKTLLYFPLEKIKIIILFWIGLFYRIEMELKNIILILYAFPTLYLILIFRIFNFQNCCKSFIMV